MATHPAPSASRTKLADTLHIQLEPGEPILWSGTSPPARILGEPLFLLIFATIWSAAVGTACILYINALIHGDPVTINGTETTDPFTRLLILGFFVPFIAAGIGTYRAAIRKRHKNAGLCAITDRRAILIVHTSRGTTISEWRGPALAHYRLQQHRRNRGDIILCQQEYDDGDGGQTIKHGFFRIENPEHAASCLLRASTYGDPPPTGELPPPSHPHGMPRTERETIHNLLLPDEQLVWIGRPHAKLDFSPTAAIAYTAIGWTTFTAALLIHQLSSSAPILDLIITTPFFLLGVGLLAAPWIRRRSMRRTAYALTTERLLAFRFKKHNVKTTEWNYAALQNTRLRLHPDGSGSIHFSSTNTGPLLSEIEHRFEDIPHAREILSLAHDIRRRQASSSNPHEKNKNG